MNDDGVTPHAQTVSVCVRFFLLSLIVNCEIHNYVSFKFYEYFFAVGIAERVKLSIVSLQQTLFWLFFQHFC